MMAFERTPTGSSLDAEIVAELRAALSRSAETGDHGNELKDLLQRVALDARTKGIFAEQLLVTLKEVWFSLPTFSSQQGVVQTRLLQELVARCIQEYYAT